MTNEQRHVLVTGAAEGVGRSIARTLAKDGARVVIADIRSADETIRLIREDGSAADQLHCDAGEVQVCTAPSADGGWNVLFDTHARPRFDCDVATETGVDLRCVDADQVCQDAKQVCEDLNGDWRWSERRCRCYQHLDPSPPTPLPLPHPDRLTVVVQVCGPEDFAELEAEMISIEAADIRTAGLHPLQLRAAAVYVRLIECNDGTDKASALIDRASRLITAFESDPALYPDYHDVIDDGFSLVHNDLLSLASRPITVDVQPEENWCTDTHAGRWWCIGFPIVMGALAIVGGVILYDFLDDGSANGIINW